MNLYKLALGLALMIALTSCDNSTKPVTVIETRKISSYDEEGNLHAVMPAEWRRVPSTKFRDFNCKFNKDGEVYISVGSGGVKENAERWLKQFGDNNSVIVPELEKIDVLGQQAAILEAEGSFTGVRGINIEDAALLGMLIEVNGGLITVKMVGKADEVKAQRENFLSFCKSIQWK